MKNYSLESISNIVANYLERFSDINNFKIIQRDDYYICTDTIFKDGKPIPRISLISPQEIYSLFEKALNATQETTIIDDDSPRTRKH